MNLYLLLIAYLPLLAGLIAVIVYLRRRHLAQLAERTKAPKEYPLQDRAIPHADRLLEDPGPSLKDSDMEELKERLCNVLEREKLYLNPDIRVGDLAERLYTNKSYLAQTIK